MKASEVYDSMNPDVRDSFAACSDDVKRRLLKLRELILDVARHTKESGTIVETLKWNVPSYLTEKPKSGVTVRLDPLMKREGKYGIYVHCQSTLIAHCKRTFGNIFEYEGNRGIVLDVRDDPPEKELREFISLALTYHLKKKNLK